MRLASAITGFFLLLYGGGISAAPQAEYLVLGAPDVAAGIPGGKLSWELRDSLGFHFNYRIVGNDQTSFRFRDEEWMVHNLTSDMHSVSLLLDWHPMGGRFRFSGGLFSYEQSFEYSVAPDIDEVIEYEMRIDPKRIASNLSRELREKGVRVTREAVESLIPKDVPRTIKIKRRIELNAQDISARAHVKYENIAPYFGFGWSNPFSRYSRLRYSIDLGVLYQAEPDIQLAMGGDALDNAEPAVRTWLDEWAFEQRLELGSKLEDYSLTPRIGFGLSYSLY